MKKALADVVTFLTLSRQLSSADETWGTTSGSDFRRFPSSCLRVSVNLATLRVLASSTKRTRTLKDTLDCDEHLSIIARAMPVR